MLSLFRNGASSFLALSLLTSSAAGEIFEALNAVPNGWTFSKIATDNQPIQLQIALQQQDVNSFEQSLLDMSTPDHPKHGQHFQSYNEMKQMLLPSKAGVNSVVHWLQSAGVTKIQQDADWINLNTTVGVASKLLNTTFQWYMSTPKNDQQLRTLQYYVPEDVSQHINMIQPTTRFSQVQPAHETGTFIRNARLQRAPLQTVNQTTCNQFITPECLKYLYKVRNYQVDPRAGSKIAFSSYLQNIAQYADLAKFERLVEPSTISRNFSVIEYNGGLNTQNSSADNSEANADVQYIVGLASPLPVTEFSIGGVGPLVPDLNEPSQADDGNEPYLAFLQNVLKMHQKDLPQVISTSYGEDEQSVPESYARTVCNLYGQLGSRGVSVIFASGDLGVGSACLTNDGTNRTRFSPIFPATCPWVTSVGATQNNSPEEAVYFSAGGFSDLWLRPAYQDVAVKSYLEKLGGRWTGLYNPRGRGFPDVSAQGVNYVVVSQGQLRSDFNGTSASAPTFASIVALLNDARLRSNRPALGFLNPWLYSSGYTALNDVVLGGSTGCDGHAPFHGPPNGSPVVPYASWNATDGWDPVTGLGTPDFSKLLNLVTSNSNCTSQH